MSKLSVKHFELLTQDTDGNSKVTAQKCLYYICRKKNNCYLVFGDKKRRFSFSKKINIKLSWLIAQEDHAPLKEHQSNRGLTK